MNSTVSASTGFSPFFLLYGREPITPLNLELSSEPESVSSVLSVIGDSFKSATAALQRTAD